MNSRKEIYDAKKDPVFRNPYVDVEEMRERVLPDGCKIPYLYVHGGFHETNVKFVFCFPQKEQYRGRFFQYLSPFPGPDEEIASLEKTGEDDIIGFCLVNGAYFVETNMGSANAFGGQKEPKMLWKSSAAAAEYSRIKAMALYGCDRPFGYVFGGSGGGYKTIACIENTSAWDGAAPYVIGSPYSLPNTITLHAQGQRTLRHVFGKIVDALDAGGSGNMYEGLTEDEAAMLKEITLMGFPPQAWFMEAAGHIDDGSLPVLIPGVKQADPRYFKDFWEAPGYLGADPEGNARRDRLIFNGIVRSVHVPGETVPEKEIREDDRGANNVDTAWKKLLADGRDAWIELEEVPRGEDLYLKGVTISFADGDAAGKQLLLGDIRGNNLVIGMCYGMDDLSGVMRLIKPGDTVTLDNSDYIAIQSYYRHQVPPDPDFHAWDQFRDEEGRPGLPQRDYIMGPVFCGTGTVQDGNIQGKVILTQSLMDESTCPWCGDWYRERVRKTKGSEEDFRIYYMEHCMHGDVSWTDCGMVTSYLGALHQALLDLSDWVERGIEPLSGTCYEMEGGSVHVAESAKERRGMQPVVMLSANGECCTHVKTREPVSLKAVAELPEGAGGVTEMTFSFSDPLFGTYAVNADSGEYEEFFAKGSSETVKGVLEPFTIEGRNGAVSAVQTSYDKPGTYFATVKVKAQRNSDAGDIYTQVKNLARARIIVE